MPPIGDTLADVKIPLTMRFRDGDEGKHLMKLVGRSPSRLLRGILGCAAFSALAACGQSSPGQTALTNPAASGAAKPAVTPAATTTLAPTVTLSTSPTTIANGGASTLSWNAANATACTAAGGWHGTVATSGTWSTGAVSNTTEYELTCSGAGGSATQS